MIHSVTYKEIDKQGIHIEVNGKSQFIEADSIIICAGQVSVNRLFNECKDRGISVHLIGGAKNATQLDAKTAIREGTELGLKI